MTDVVDFEKRLAAKREAAARACASYNRTITQQRVLERAVRHLREDGNTDVEIARALQSMASMLRGKE